MPHIKVMLADNDINLRANIRRFFSSKEEITLIAEAGNGTEALEKIERFCPDMLILDVVLPQIDGLSVLEILSHKARRPRVIMHTSLRGDALINRAMQMGADYYMLKPVQPDCLYARILELAPVQPSCEPLPFPTTVIASLLRTLGLRPGMQSTLCTEHAAMLAISDPSLLNGVTKRLYPQVAQRCRTSSASVEHAIREAAHVCWDTDHCRTLQNNLSRCPSNVLFLSLLTEKLCTLQEEILCSRDSHTIKKNMPYCNQSLTWASTLL